MSKDTIWTHGNSLVVEDPGEYQNIRHRGWGTVLTYARRRDDEQNLDSLPARICHIPIPTPSSVDGAVPWLTNIYVLFETQGWAKVGGVSVWDANNLVQSFPGDENAELEGRYGNFLTASAYNQFTLDEPHVVTNGIGVSLACYLDFVPFNPPGQPQFSEPAESDPWVLTVAAVGADFVFPRSPITLYTGFTESAAVKLKTPPVKVGGK